MINSLETIYSLFKLSGKSKIAIVGKGPSLDNIDLNVLKDFFVINVNDSEKVYEGDICLYHLGSIKDFLKDNKGGCSLYVTSQPIQNDNRFITVEHNFENPENIKPIQERFFDKAFYLEDAIIISALKIANLIADNNRIKLPVYLLGFDFSIKSGFSIKADNSVAFGSENYVENLFESQEAYLSLLLSHEAELSIKVNHIGDKEFSSYNVNRFNALFDGSTNQEKRTASLNQVVKGAVNNYKVKVIAEITTNHFGDLELLKKMIKAAAESGADYIKLQKRDVESFYTEEQLTAPYQSPFGDTFRDYRHGLELDEFGFRLVDQWCEEFGIKWFASVLDLPSYLFMKKFNPELIKLPSTISEHTEFLKEVAADFTGDVVLSTGMTDAAYEDFIIEEFKNCRNLYLLQCVSSYPTVNEHANVAVVRHYHDLSKKHKKIIPGYSSHDIGSLCCQLSVAAGGLMVEKHVKYGNTPWAHFDNVAMDMLTDKFKHFVDDIRLAEVCLGEDSKNVLSSEHHKYRKI